MRLNEMHDFCRGMDYQVASAYAPGKPDGAWWCFGSKEDADAFAARYASG